MKVHDHFFSLGAVVLALGGVAVRFALAQARSDAHTAQQTTGEDALLGLEGDDTCGQGGEACTISLLQRSAAALTHMKVPTAAASLHRKAAVGLVEWPLARPTGFEDGLPVEFVQRALMASWACVAFYMACVAWDIYKLYRLSSKPRDKSNQINSKNDGEPWSAGRIWMLCFYRLYTGFLAATWLPYVLAMEGETLWASNQALFMGTAKLIYGLTVLMNPMFGLVGDMLAEICHGAARQLWILLGIILSALGIMVCLYAGPRKEFWFYMFGITLWRLGESLNDVTTEAIVPELVPTQQFAVASSIKAASFLVGGLLGYILLFFMAEVHYTWCYFAYLGCMFVFAVPSLYLLINDKQAPRNPFRPKDTSFSENLWLSYETPATLEGGFPQMCFAIFMMSCGTAPMFFFLLIIRDLIGVHEEVPLQQDFAIGSVLFFLSAAIATMLDVTFGDRIGPASRAQHLDAQALQELTPRSRKENLAKVKTWENEKVRRLIVLAVISVVYALSVCSLPIVQLLPTVSARLTFFYPLVVFFGGTFGIGYSRFQDLTWRLLPQNCDMANAMGFNVMARNFGLGVGNFCFGALLEFFKVPQVAVAVSTTLTTTTHGFTVDAMQSASAHQVYEKAGYDAMCFGCMIFNFAAGILAYRITFILPKPEED